MKQVDYCTASNKTQPSWQRSCRRHSSYLLTNRLLGILTGTIGYTPTPASTTILRFAAFYLAGVYHYQGGCTVGPSDTYLCNMLHFLVFLIQAGDRECDSGRI